MIVNLQEIRSEYQDQREALEEKFLQDLRPDDYLRQHTAIVDRLIRRLAAPQIGEGEFAVLATAGYGRNEQFPESDVDLLVVHSLSDGQAEQVVAPYLNQLWDTRLRLGHQVWSLKQFRRLTMDDFEFVLAMFNARLVAGPDELGVQVLEEILPRFLTRHRDRLVDEIVRTVRERHEEFGNTIYQLEPDVKEAPGGLRDLLASDWLDRLVGSADFVPYRLAEVQQAHEFLKKTRILLHLFHKRPDDRLTHSLQEQLLPYFGFRGVSTRTGVEGLMKQYFLNARIVSSSCEAFLEGARPTKNEALSLEELPPLDSAERVLEIFRISRDQSRPLGSEVRDRIQRFAAERPDSIRHPELRELMKELFRPCPGLYRLLSDLYALGLLELLFPEFSHIKARVIRDFYHKFTVDEHTLIAIKSVEDLLTGEENADPRFRSILGDTIVPVHLTLALLLHDVGKGKGGRHSDESTQMARTALQRFQFEPEEIETVLFLIQNHLAMSAVIFRRDIEDDAVVKRFADLVGTPEKLRLLTLLTYADIKAVAPGTLNDWKRDLLWQLYLETYRKLTVEYGEERIREERDLGEQLLEKLDRDLDREEFEDFLEGFPTRYLKTTPAEEVFEHFRMSSRVSPENPVETHLVSRSNFEELCVVTPDRSRLFAKIVGLLSFFEMNILRGYAFANHRETILDFFQFEDERSSFRHQEEKDRFRSLLMRAVKDEVDVEKLVEGKENSVLFKRKTPYFEPTIYFEDEKEKTYSILEIVAPDSLGLLYRISRQIARLDCEIDLALISTEGDKAVDVFYLRQGGDKLSMELKRELTHRIGEAIQSQS